MWRGRPVFDTVPVAEPVAELNRCGRQAAVYILALSLQGEAGEIPVCRPGSSPCCSSPTIACGQPESMGEAVGVGHQAAYGQQPSPVTGNFGAARLVR